MSLSSFVHPLACTPRFISNTTELTFPESTDSGGGVGRISRQVGLTRDAWIRVTAAPSRSPAMYFSLFTAHCSNNTRLLYISFQYCLRVRDNSIGIGTRYGPDGPGIESRWGARFYAPI